MSSKQCVSNRAESKVPTTVQATPKQLSQRVRYEQAKRQHTFPTGVAGLVATRAVVLTSLQRIK